MFVYIFTIILCTFFSFISICNKNKRNFIISAIPMLLLVLVSALRYNVGIDYSGTYTEVYYQVLYNSPKIRMDIGFLYLYKIIVFLNLDVQYFFVITSILINYIIFLSIEKLSLNKCLSYFIYICSTFYFFTMNGIRQSFVMAIFYLSIKLIREKKIIKFLILNLIASLFHQSALIFLPVYWLVNHPFKRKKTYILLLIILAISVPTLLPLLTNLLSNTKYVLYFLHNNYNALASLNFSSIFNFLLFLIYLYKLDFNKKNDTIGFTYMICHFLGACLSLFLTSIPLTLRIFESFRFIDYLSIPHIINKYVRRNKKIFYWMIILFYILYFVFHVCINNANGVLPYKTIFER